MSKRHVVAIAVVAWAMVGMGTDAVEQQRHMRPVAVTELTAEEAARPAEEWTLQQVMAKGWTPYDCFPGIGRGGRAVEGRRWPNNDPGAGNLGTCVSYSFMPAGVAMEVGEGFCTWPLALVAGAATPAAAVTSATVTWAGVADIHFTLVADGGGAHNAAGAAGLRGNLRIGASPIPPVRVLAHGYYPPPNGVSQAGDVHFDNSANHPWSTAAVPPAGAFDVETVALHELGHALGLTHAGTFAGDVMFPTYSGVMRNFATSVTDIGFMTAIYGVAGHVAQCTGACCHATNVCSDDTQAWCIANGFSWRGPGTRCPTGSNTRTAQHASGPVTHWSDPTLDCYQITFRGVQGCIPGILIDSWNTSEELTQQTCHQFGCCPESPPIPADFFEPGSEPFYGDVCLMGEPLGPSNYGEYGEADTLILRSADPFDRCELPPAGEQRTVDIEIVALSLKSIEPITVWTMGFPMQWDVAVDLSTYPAPLGQLVAMKEHCNGGTYYSILPVQPRFTFTKLPGQPGIPGGSVVVLDTGLEGLPPVFLDQMNNPPWSNDLDPYLNLASGGEGCTGFHPGVEDANPQTACDCQPNGIRDDCDIENCPAGDLACADCNANGIPDECDPDADGDGIPDDCDQCPDVPGLCMACTALDARSYKVHGGGVGRLGIQMGVSGGIEPRLGGIVDLEIDLDSSAGFGGGVTVNCNLSGDVSASVAGTTTVGNTVAVTFSTALPNREVCIVRLDCTAEVCVRGLEGDTDRNAVVQVTDGSIIKPKYGQTPTSATAVHDYDTSGVIQVTDQSLIKPKYAQTVGICP